MRKYMKIANIDYIHMTRQENILGVSWFINCTFLYKPMLMNYINDTSINNKDLRIINKHGYALCRIKHHNSYRVMNEQIIQVYFKALIYKNIEDLKYDPIELCVDTKSICPTCIEMMKKYDECTSTVQIKEGLRILL